MQEQIPPRSSSLARPIQRLLGPRSSSQETLTDMGVQLLSAQYARTLEECLRILTREEARGRMLSSRENSSSPPGTIIRRPHAIQVTMVDAEDERPGRSGTLEDTIAVAEGRGQHKRGQHLSSSSTWSAGSAAARPPRRSSRNFLQNMFGRRNGA